MFASSQFRALFEIENDPQEVTINFKYSRVTDQSAIHAIEWLIARYQAAGKNLHLHHLSPDCEGILSKALTG